MFDAEYFAAHEACKQLKWLQVLTEQIKHPLELPVPLHCNNKSCVDASVSFNVKHRTKHMCICAHFVYESVSEGLVELVRIPGTDNPADIFTKSLPRKVHEKHTKALGLALSHLSEGEY